MTQGETLKALRLRTPGLTQDKLAKRAGISTSALAHNEADMRQGRGMNRDTALRVLSALHDAKPLSEDEIELSLQVFKLDRHDLHTVLSDVVLPESAEGMRPDTKALFLGAAGELSSFIGEQAALEIFEKITRAVDLGIQEALLKDRKARIAELESLQNARTGSGKTTLVSIAQEGGAVVETRTPHDADGNPLRPVPAGQGIVDDPNLALADRLKVVEDQLRKAAKPGEKLSPQELADHLKAIGQDLKRTTG